VHHGEHDILLLTMGQYQNCNQPSITCLNFSYSFHGVYNCGSEMSNSLSSSDIFVLSYNIIDQRVENGRKFSDSFHKLKWVFFLTFMGG
jgi:hypothetical protein